MRNSDVGLKPDELLAMVREMFRTYDIQAKGTAMPTHASEKSPYSGAPMPETEEEMEKHRKSRGSFGFYDPNR